MAVRQSHETAQNIRFVTLYRPLADQPVRWSEALPLLAAAPSHNAPTRGTAPDRILFPTP